MTYKPLRDFVKGFDPTKSCSQYILEDVATALPQAWSIPETVEECKRIAASKVDFGAGAAVGLTSQEVFALVVYTFDLSLLRRLEDDEGCHCLYKQINEALQRRDNSLISRLEGYLHFLMCGLGKLQLWSGLVYRGIRSEGVAMILEHYKEGRRVHFSGLTSTSTSLAVAQQFAAEDGLIMRIRVRSGRQLGVLSAIEQEEEVLLMPNFSAIVTSSACEDDSGQLIIDLVEAAEEKTYVF